MHRAIILAAGRGSRMGGLTATTPKALIKLGGQPLIERQQNSLRAAGCDPIAIVTGYQSQLFDRYAFHRFHNKHWDTTDMVVSLLEADDWLSRYPCIIAYADIFYTADCIRALIQTRDSLAISYDPHWREQWEARFADPLDDAETFALGPGHYLAEIGEKTNNIQDIEGQYMGLIKTTPDGWLLIKETLIHYNKKQLAKIQMTFLLNNLCHQGIKVKAVPCESPWGEIDSASDLAYFEKNGALFFSTA